jgi:hypothetical protein
VVHANPYSSGAVALVFVCSITGAIAPSYEVDGIDGRLDLEPKVPILLYIGRRGRFTERAIGLTNCFLVCYNKLILVTVQICLPWFALIFMLVNRVSPCRPSLDGCWANSLVVVVYTGGAGTPGPYL